MNKAASLTHQCDMLRGRRLRGDRSTHVQSSDVFSQSDETIARLGLTGPLWERGLRTPKE
jgi:hypothetical protein